MVKVTIEIEEKKHEMLKEEAKKNFRSIKGELSAILEDYIKNKSNNNQREKSLLGL